MIHLDVALPPPRDSRVTFIHSFHRKMSGIKLRLRLLHSYDVAGTVLPAIRVRSIDVLPC